MKSNIITIFCVILLFLCSCNKKIALDPNLLTIERMIEVDADSAKILLDNYTLPEHPLDQSYYSVLLAAITSKTGKLTVANDSLLDIAVRYFKKNDYKVYEAKALLYRGRVWETVNMEEDALPYYYQALDILERHPDYATQTKVYSDLGNIYIEQDLYGKAELMFNKVYECDSIAGKKDYMILSLCDLAELSMFQDKLDEHKMYMQKAYQMAEETEQMKKHLSYLDYFYSVYLIRIGDYTNALDHISKSIASEENKKAYSKYLIKGDILNTLHQSDSAQYYLSMSLTSDDIYVQTSGHNKLFQLYHSKKDFQKAIDHLLEYQAGVDSILELTNQAELQAIIYKYDKEKAVLKINSRNKVHTLMLISFFIILLLSFSLLFIWRDRKMRLRQKEKEKEILRQENEKEILRQENEKEILKNEKERLQKEKEIRMLRNEMTILQKNKSEYKVLENKFDEYQNLILNKERELFALMEKEIKVQCEVFKEVLIYKRIIALSEQKKDKDRKTLTYEEQDELLIQLNISFTKFIKELKESYPSLTKKNLMMCCLSVLRLSTFAISLCFAISEDGVRQRKSRIKGKMLEIPENAYLYDFIFLDMKD